MTDQEKQPETATPPVEENAAPEEKAAPEPKRISIDRFFETELRVARVLACEPHPNADKLLKIQVDLGTEKRQIVAGLAKAYQPEELVGKTIIVVANLKPAKLRGEESNGMLLAADLDGKPVVATFDAEIPPGTQVR